MPIRTHKQAVTLTRDVYVFLVGICLSHDGPPCLNRTEPNRERGSLACPAVRSFLDPVLPVHLCIVAKNSRTLFGKREREKNRKLQLETRQTMVKFVVPTGPCDRVIPSR